MAIRNLENSITVKNVANGRCLVDMCIPFQAARKRCLWACSIIFCVRLLQVCSFYSDGQFQSL
ncbi:MAG: hypothetical protein K1W14_04525 [Muribaculaceae bacterium]